MQWLCGNALGGNGWSGIVMSGAVILFWGGVIATGYYLIKSLTPGNGTVNQSILVEVLSRAIKDGRAISLKKCTSKY